MTERSDSTSADSDRQDSRGAAAVRQTVGEKACKACFRSHEGLRRQ
ncbi:MAG: hypothetical protein PUA92_02980 [Clostridium sp.]|nr:hypothetical protein [Clostridium sp.]